jgi:hypothetical protein
MTYAITGYTAAIVVAFTDEHGNITHTSVPDAKIAPLCDWTGCDRIATHAEYDPQGYLLSCTGHVHEAPCTNDDCAGVSKHVDSIGQPWCESCWVGAAADLDALTLTVDCPVCNAGPGTACTAPPARQESAMREATGRR